MKAFMIVLALFAVGCLIFAAFEEGRVRTNRKWAEALSGLEPVRESTVTYDIVFWYEGHKRVNVAPVQGGAIEMQGDCVVITAPQFRSFCGVIAVYPCHERCEIRE